MKFPLAAIIFFAFFVGLLLPWFLPAETVYALEQKVEDMILIPAGPFTVGTDPFPGNGEIRYGIDEAPRHVVDLKAFYIDKFEVTVGPFREFLQEQGRSWVEDSLFANIYPEKVLSDPVEFAKFPANYVEWGNADAYCRRLGKRLPTEAEWEKASRGTEGREYPWGNTFDPTLSNVRELNLGRPVAVGSFPEDKSPFGVYDMGGNVAEWTSSLYLPYPGSPVTHDSRWTDQAYVIKGGSFHMPGAMFSRGAYRSLAYPAYSHMMYGFRCVKDAE